MYLCKTYKGHKKVQLSYVWPQIGHAWFRFFSFIFLLSIYIVVKIKTLSFSDRELK